MERINYIEEKNNIELYTVKYKVSKHNVRYIHILSETTLSLFIFQVKYPESI